MPEVHYSYWAPWFRHPYQVVKYWRAFLGTPDSEGWGAKLRRAVGTAIVAFEVEDHWRAKMLPGLDQYQRRALKAVLRQLDQQEQRLRGIETTLNATDDVSALWAGAALPLVYAPGSVIDNLASIRNQLLELGAPPDATVITSDKNSHALQPWGAPGWPADWFQRTVSQVWTQAEKSAPGEPSTAADISEDALASAQQAAAAAWEATKEAAGAAAEAAGSTVELLPWAIAAGVVLYISK